MNADPAATIARDELRASVLAVLAAIAPEADPASLRPDLSLRDQLDLDSVDVMNYVAALGARFGIEIPERDYPQLFRLDACVAYLARRVAKAGDGSV
jgi:acyl carrier protein